MRVIVDTSVWSLALRRGREPSHSAVRKLRLLLLADEDIALVGVILQEVLQGFRSDAIFRDMQRALAPFPILEPSRDIYIAAAQLKRTCAAAGVTASTVDCNIAATAIEHGCSLLSADKDFVRIARHSALELL